MAKNEKEIIISSRIRKEKGEVVEISSEEKDKKRYELLKESLKGRIDEEIQNKLATMEILYEIKEKELYRFDNYKSFEVFLKDFNFRRSQAYLYLKLAEAILTGKISKAEILKIGTTNAYKLIQSKDPKSKINLLKPLRFQIRNEEAYEFYKQYMKFTSWMLEDIFLNSSDYLENKIKEYKEMKLTK